MKRLVRFVLPSLTLAMSGLVAAGQPAGAALPAPGIEVEAKSPHCPASGEEDHSPSKVAARSEEQGNNCQANAANLTAADIHYALLNVQSLHPRPVEGGSGDNQARNSEGSNGGYSGKPDFVNLVCAHGLEAARLTVFPGQPGGTIHGQVRVGKNPTEKNTHALGQVAIWATDGTTTGVAFGTQISNNVDPFDSLVGGGFHITLRGPITNEITHASRYGEMSCFTGHRPIYGINDGFVAPPYFESILNTDADTDNS